MCRAKSPRTEPLAGTDFPSGRHRRSLSRRVAHCGADTPRPAKSSATGLADEAGFRIFVAVKRVRVSDRRRHPLRLRPQRIVPRKPLKQHVILMGKRWRRRRHPRVRLAGVGRPPISASPTRGAAARAYGLDLRRVAELVEQERRWKPAGAVRAEATALPRAPLTRPVAIERARSASSGR